MPIDEKTGEKIALPKKLAEMLGIDSSYIRHWWRRGELKRRVVESDRSIYYFVEDVRRLSRQKAEMNKKRGGRPRKSGTAA